MDGFKALAGGRARSSLETISAILRLEESERPAHSEIDANEIADLAMAAANVDGTKGVIHFLGRWGPHEFVYRVARKLARRLFDSDRADLVEEIALQSGDAIAIPLAITQVMFDYDLAPSIAMCERLTEVLSYQSGCFELTGDYSMAPLRGVAWCLVHGLRSGCIDESVALRILDQYLPAHMPNHAWSPWAAPSPVPTMLAFALGARLRGTFLAMENLMSKELKDKAQEKNVRYGEVFHFEANIGRLVPWVERWLEILLDGPTVENTEKLTRLIGDDLAPVSSYDTPYVFLGAVSEVATRMLVAAGDQVSIGAFSRWHRAADSFVDRSRLTVARIANRAPKLAAFGLDVTYRGFRAAMAERTDAEVRIDTLIQLARTLLATNESKARAFFAEALKEADQVGDDMYARWRALAHTAELLNTGGEPERAYRLFQIGERLDSVDTVGLGECLRGMHETSYFAHASRARDRRSTQLADMITPAFESATGDPNRIALLALYAFEPRCGWKPLLENFSQDAAQLATEVLGHFDRYKASSKDEGTRSSPLESRMAEVVEPPNYLKVKYGQFDFTLEASWNAVLEHLPWSGEERGALFTFALERFETRRADVLEAFCSATRSGFHDFVGMAKMAAMVQPQTPGLKQSLERFGNTFARRFAEHICTVARPDDYVGPVAAATGAGEAELLQVALQELGRSAPQLSYGDYFILASRIAATLDVKEVGRVFDTLAGLFEDLVPSGTASDGEYASLTSLPGDLASAIAGLIWASLGDMASDIRWQAAHALVLLVKLGCADVLGALARFADGTSSHTAFVDSRFVFYGLHARMWLLLALARAALEPGAEVLSTFTPWLVAVVQGPFHAVNQVLAQRTLALLADRELDEVTTGLDVAVAARLQPEWVELTYSERHLRLNPLALSAPDPDEDSKYHRYFLDFAQYWCRELGEVFGSTMNDVARCATDIAPTINGYDSLVAEIDARRDAGTYGEGRTYPDRDSWPVLDNLSFYVAVHSLFCLGAKLGSTLVAYKDEGSEHDAYTEWLARFLPKRPDGRWLSDRRDPPPEPAPDAQLRRREQSGAAAIENWPWSIRRSDFDEIAGVEDDWVTVWSWLDAATGELSQGSSVQSALVPHETAQALLIALQTSPRGPTEFSMPTTNDNYNSPSDYPYQLTPWVCNLHLDYGIDVGDRRAGGVDFPPVRPADDIVTRFGLGADDDLREWSHEGKPVLRSRAWNDMAEQFRDREVGSRGYELQVHRDFLSVVLGHLDRSLILIAGLRRQRHRSYYERRRGPDDELDYLWCSGKVYVVDPRGGWTEY